MKIEVITSFHKPYFDLIGKDCIDSIIKYWPSEINLTCYVEGFDMVGYDQIKKINFTELGNDYINFQNKNYTSKTKKFAKKAFSFIHAMENSDADRIIWIDADTVTRKNMSLKFLKSLLPDSVLSTHMGVVYTSDKKGNIGNWLVPETGFFGVNTSHNLFQDFRNRYKDNYIKGTFDGLRRQYDNDVYGSVINDLQAPTLDLCKEFKKSFKTPLKHTVLGEYLFHYKAKHSKDSIATLKNLPVVR